MSVSCPVCGNAMEVGDVFCRRCGSRSIPVVTSAVSSIDAPAGAVSTETSGKAIGSLICGLLFLFFPFAIVAIILGHISLSEIRKSAGRLTGQGLAIAGLVLGYAGVVAIPLILIIAAIAIPNLLRARIAANESSAVGQVRALVVAEINYGAAHPEEGFTCSLKALRDGGLISTDLTNGKYGYGYELSGCTPGTEGGANKTFQIEAYPLRINQTGVRAFCSDESGVMKVDSHGSSQGCRENGRTLQ